jgi:ribonuclease PH
VLQADGGTRTAAICGAYVALVDALAKLPKELPPPKNPSDLTRFPARYDPARYDPAHAIVAPLAAVSVGTVDGEERLDLDYIDDSRADVDMNVAYTARGEFVEIQGAAENGGSFDRKRMDRLLDLAVAGCEKLMTLQADALRNDP